MRETGEEFRQGKIASLRPGEPRSQGTVERAVLAEFQQLGPGFRERRARSGRGNHGKTAFSRSDSFPASRLAAGRGCPQDSRKRDPRRGRHGATERRGYRPQGQLRHQPAPSDFVMTEDGIPRKSRRLRKATKATRRPPKRRPQTSGPAPAGSAAPARHATVRRGRRDSAPSGWRQRLHPVRHQQLHVPRLRLRPGRHRGLRALPGPPRPVAFYSYSRDFSRAASLTADRMPGPARRARTTITGDDSALYNACC